MKLHQKVFVRSSKSRLKIAPTINYLRLGDFPAAIIACADEFWGGEPPYLFDETSCVEAGFIPAN